MYIIYIYIYACIAFTVEPYGSNNLGGFQAHSQRTICDLELVPRSFPCFSYPHSLTPLCIDGNRASGGYRVNRNVPSASTNSR